MTVATEHPDRRSASTSREIMRLVLPAIFVLIGIMILVYPVVSSQYNNYRQREVVRQYEERIKKLPQAKKQNLFAEAEKYNKEHQNGPVLDPWLARITPDNVAYQKYLHILGDGTFVPLSQLVFPAAKINLPVYHGSDEYVLQRGVGHLFGSSMPIGGPGTHAVLTGHTGLTNATLFDNLSKVKVGEPFYIDTLGKKLKYVVSDIRVVLPDQTKALKVVPGEDLVTLITCTPYGINTHRLLVTGKRAPMDEQAKEAIGDSPSGLSWQWWMIVALAVAGIALLLLIIWLVRSIRAILRRKKTDESRSVAL